MKITMSIKTEPELKAKLEYIIKGSGMSLSDVIKTALFQYCDRYEMAKGEIPRDYIDNRAAEIIAMTERRKKK